MFLMYSSNLTEVSNSLWAPGQIRTMGLMDWTGPGAWLAGPAAVGQAATDTRAVQIKPYFTSCYRLPCLLGLAILDSALGYCP